MESNHKLGLYVSYYLARFDQVAYQALGYGNQIETHTKIGELLAVNPHTVKNWRDEFDPLFGHRVGWYQRRMSPSRMKVAQALEGLDRQAIHEIVVDILSGNIEENMDEKEQLLTVASGDNDNAAIEQAMIRGSTGRAAEKLFIEYFEKFRKPHDGTLVDCRDLGVGYDFRIETTNNHYFIEVKGVTENSGGILLTNKEWSTAKAEGERYILCVISNIGEQPEVDFIKNISTRIKPRKYIYTSIQVNWTVSANQLSKLND